MSDVKNFSRPTSHSLIPPALEAVYQSVQSEMEGVDTIIRESLFYDVPAVNEIVRYSIQLSGKRIRPLLLLLTAKSLGEIRREHLLSAAAIEIIHTGTLVHDDILDGAHFRRHLETVNLHWDSKIAVLGGDFLLTKALSLILECEDVEVYRVIADACRLTCEGELLQTASCRAFDLSVVDYMRIIAGKTASLIEASCRLGACFTGQSQEVISAFSRFGSLLGKAFQIFDDILDLVGDQEKTGKTLGTDLLNQKPTLPLIYYLEKANPDQKRELLAQLESEDLNPEKAKEICWLLQESGAIEAARQTGQDFILQGKEILDSLPASELPRQEEAKNHLKSVAQFIMDRNL